ncbi:alpha/beta fold hydrolase [Nakamurella deserti]|uniref:alpha/beta fold hydrolase n=1 Tax=Nakamurella deserti TaxID=2164074 RepID=UPI000DBE8ED2|nr:alpha/beta hydrolase [Nakamurella deserti]
MTSAVSRHFARTLGVPDGPVVMFAHGFGCDQNMWNRLLPAFTDKFRVVVFDLVGSGRSDLAAYDPGKYADLDGYATDILELCDEMGLADVVLVGHSVSSMIGVAAAVRRPDLFRRLVLVSPSPRFIDDDGYAGGFSEADIEGLLESLDSNYFGWAAAMAPAVMGAGQPGELQDELTTSFCRTRPDIAYNFARVTFLSDARRLLDQVSVPSLILQTSDDILAPVEVGLYVHRHLRGSAFVQLEATGHCPHVSAPDETARAVLAYLDDDRTHDGARTPGNVTG